MTQKIQSGLISRRRAFSLIGVALPATIFTVSQVAAQTPGMERREERREERRGVVDQPATTGSTAPPPEEKTYHGGPKSDD
jgi:hypothetical protein